MRKNLGPGAVVILAGGEGRRIGGGKPQRMLGGKSLLERALAQAQGWSSLIAISSRHGLELIPDSDIPQLIDGSDRGPIAGIAAALGFARQQGVDHVLTIPCDTPFLPTDLPDRLEAALTGAAGAALAMSKGRLHPTCGLWRVTCLDEIPLYLATGRASLHGFAEAVGAISVEWPVEPIDPFFNINTAPDLAQAEAWLRNR